MAFVHHYPFDFRLLNDKGEDEFYLEDKQGFVNLAITNSSGKPIDLNKPIKGDYHFALKFRPGTLNTTAKAPEQTVSTWKISSLENGENGCTMLKLTYTGNSLQVKNGETLNLNFNLNVNGSLGTRSTNVVLLDNVSEPGKPRPRQINWTIINHRGKPNMPLELTFKDADTILNDGTPNSLSFRISNTNKNSAFTDPRVHFNSNEKEGPVSKIYIFFDTGDNAAHVLAKADTVKDITVALQNNKALINPFNLWSDADPNSKLRAMEEQVRRMLEVAVANKNDFIKTFGEGNAETIWQDMLAKGWIAKLQINKAVVRPSHLWSRADANSILQAKEERVWELLNSVVDKDNFTIAFGAEDGETIWRIVLAKSLIVRVKNNRAVINPSNLWSEADDDSTWQANKDRLNEMLSGVADKDNFIRLFGGEVGESIWSDMLAKGWIASPQNNKAVINPFNQWSEADPNSSLQANQEQVWKMLNTLADKDDFIEAFGAEDAESIWRDLLTKGWITSPQSNRASINPFNLWTAADANSTLQANQERVWKTLKILAAKDDFIHTFGADDAESIWRDMLVKGWINLQSSIFTSLFTFDHSLDPLPVWIFKTSQPFCLLPHISVDANDPNRVANPALHDQKTETTTIDFTVANIITNYITGKTRMYVRFENIPGYWDDTFVLEIDKQPLVMRGNSVGIGAIPSRWPLTIKGSTPATEFLSLQDVNGHTIWHLNMVGGNGLNFVETGVADYRVFLQRGGNIGIGTSSPEQKLHIYSDRADAIAVVDVPDNESYDPISAYRVSGHSVWNTGIDNSDSNKFKISSGGGWNNLGTGDKLTIDTSGNVGIGTTTPANKLEVNGALAANLGLFVTNSRSAGICPVGDALSFRTNNVDNRMVIDYSGNVGIGTTSPSNTLSVAGNADFTGNVGIGCAPDSQNSGTSGTYNKIQVEGALTASQGLFATIGRSVGINNALGDGTSLSFRTNTTDNRMVITKDGNVGIGTSEPYAALHVNGSNTYDFNKYYLKGKDYRYVSIRNFGYKDYDETNSYAASIFANGRIICDELDAFSDKRIKEITGITNSADALGAISKLKITNYKYRDTIGHTASIKTGLIAQEVEEILPQTVSKITNYIPDIYAVADELYLIECSLYVRMNKVHELHEGDKVKLITASNKYVEAPVKIADATTFIIEDWTEPVEQLFVYGRQVNDFRVLDYDQIFASGICAIQELSKQVNELRGELQTQETTLKNLKELVQISYQ